MDARNETLPQIFCGWCGQQHGARCPIVKALEYDKEGRIRRVEFITDADAPPDCAREWRPAKAGVTANLS